MVDITLFDGTRDQKYGRVLGSVLGEMTQYVGPIKCTPKPGSIDIPRYNLVKHVESQTLDPTRQQVDEGLMIGMLDNLRLIRDDPAAKVVFTERDLFAPGINWAFGGFVNYLDRNYIVISTARITRPVHFQDLIAHELGHMYGAAPAGRTNTEENLGSHCTNNLCVMQQHLTVSGSQNYAMQRHQASAPLFCGQCTDELGRRAQRM